MPAAIPMHKRNEIVQRRQQGISFVAIAEEFAISYEAVRNIYHRFIRTGQLTPAYDRCSHRDIRSNQDIYAQAVALKQTHPSWGAGLIWTELAEAYAEDDLPSIRTLQRWFRRAGVQKPRPERIPTGTVKRGKGAHEVWAIDAKEDIRLADGSQHSWLTITDEGSGAILSGTLFPHKTVDSHRTAARQGDTASGDAVLGMSRKDQDG